MFSKSKIVLINIILKYWETSLPKKNFWKKSKTNEFEDEEERRRRRRKKKKKKMNFTPLYNRRWEDAVINSDFKKVFFGFCYLFGFFSNPNQDTPVWKTCSLKKSNFQFVIRSNVTKKIKNNFYGNINSIYYQTIDMSKTKSPNFP